MVAGRGVGYFEYALDLPRDLELRSIGSIELVFEASAAIAGAHQTEPTKAPSDLTVKINGVNVKTATLPDAPADARGALSYINGLPGRYGYLHRVRVAGNTLAQIKQVLAGNRLTLRLEVNADAAHKGGVTLFGERVGRYPVAPHVVISR